MDIQIKLLKSGKAAGCDGLAPGVLKFLDDEWILLLTYLFNQVFSGEYPKDWTLLKVFNIFKKGCRLDTCNYRGISIMVALAKLYDMVLAARFIQWYKPCPEQAGSQKGRGCEEQILALRLMIDIARKMKNILYITFVDYQTAYDKVDRYKLLKQLDTKGCGTRFLKAIQASLQNTTGVIGNTMFSTTAGVKQGGCTSCPLFTCYIDSTIEAISSVGPDGWLGKFHCLLLMDDTVLFATSRNKMIEKLNKLKRCTEDIGMVIHPNKSMFLTVNTTDRTTICLNDVKIRYTKEYIYLGTNISNSTCANQVKSHIKGKGSHVLKFSSFLVKNADAPYNVKKKVWESALKSSILYGCESWLTSDLRVVDKPYMSTLKQLLGVRQATCNELVLAETGLSDIKSQIQDKQSAFLKKLVTRDGFRDSYLEHTVNMAVDTQSPMGLQLQSYTDLIRGNGRSAVSVSMEALHAKIHDSPSTRRVTYCEINPNLSVNVMYSKDCVVPEYARVATTRLRLSSHRLRVETGRWSRIPREERKCDCGEIQMEEHVLLFCPLSAHIRNNFPLASQCRSVAQLFGAVNSANVKEMCVFCEKILNIYK